MKSSYHAAKAIFDAIAYTLTQASFSVTGQVPDCQDITEATRAIFNDYMENELGITEIESLVF